MKQTRLIPFRKLIKLALPIGLLFGASAVVGQTPAQIAAALSTAEPPAKVDGLILSPVQRKNLEFVRGAGGSDARGRSTEDVLLGVADVAVSNKLAISGVVIRSDNRSTVWVNNQPLYGQGGSSALRNLAGQVGVVGQGAGDMSIKSKPGQIIDVPTRQAADLLPPGAIVINRPKAGTRPATVKEQP